MYKAIIIDDEEMAKTLLEGMIEQYCPAIKVLALCSDLPNGVKAIRKYKPDIVFLDIEMPGHSGLELLDFFDEHDIDFSIIFTTAYHQYAIQAFKMSAVDYLLKPFDADELIQAVSLFEKQIKNKNYSVLKENMSSSFKKIALSTSNSVLFVSVENILYLKAEGAYTHVFLHGGDTLLTSKNLKYYQDLLSLDKNFYRCHKSFIVNMNHITEYVRADGGYLKIGEHNINISSDKIPAVLERLTS